MKKKLIAAYIRVSTSKQADMGQSLEMQKELIVKQAKLLEIVKSEREIKFYMDNGYSGKSLERPAMTRFLKDLSEGKIKMLFAYDLSRLSRSITDTDILLHLFQKHKIYVKFIYSDYDAETATGRYTIFLSSLNNQYERERISERTNDALTAIAERNQYPVGGITPYGYKRTNDNYIKIDDEEAEIIKMIFDYASNKKPYVELLSLLKEKARKRKWNVTTIKKIIKDKKYMGVFKYKGKEYLHTFPPLVDKNIFNLSQDYFSKQKRHNSSYLYENVLYCHLHNIKLTCSFGTSATHNLYFYYKCPKCNKLISQKEIDKILSGKTFAKGFEKRFEEKIKILKKERNNTIIRMNKLKEGFINENIELKYYLELMKPLKKLLKELEILLTSYGFADDDFDKLTKDEERKGFVMTHIKKITINVEKKKVITIDYI